MYDISLSGYDIFNFDVEARKAEECLEGESWKAGLRVRLRRRIREGRL